ncbi:MAG: hypothetical protein N4A72_12450 [Bacteroidales bacterium]|jgi:DNA polymerase III delta prime subunit|nr:hypothetical protein [Bacteroidales bacterium]
MKAQLTEISRLFFNSRTAQEKIAKIMKSGKTIENVEVTIDGKQYIISKDDYRQIISETGEILAEADKYMAGLI